MSGPFARFRLEERLDNLVNAWEGSQVKAYLDRRDRRVKYALIGLVALIPVVLLYIALRPAAPEAPVKAEQKERGPVKFVMPSILDDSRPATPGSELPGPLPKSGKNALVYFFHMTGRTDPDLALEEYAREGVKKHFAGGYRGWNVWFSPIDLEEGTNARFADTYLLAEKSLVVQKFSGDVPQAWRKLDRAWEMAGSSAALAGYLAAETKKFLDEGGGLMVTVSTVPGVVLPPGADTEAQEAALALMKSSFSAEAPGASTGVPAGLPGMEGPAAASTSAAAGSPAP